MLTSRSTGAGGARLPPNSLPDPIPLKIQFPFSNVASDLRCIEGRTYFLVARYDSYRDLPSEISLTVVDAESGELTPEPVSWPLRNSYLEEAATFDQLTVRNNQGGLFEFDEIRMGTRWQSVTRPSVPPPRP